MYDSPINLNWHDEVYEMMKDGIDNAIVEKATVVCGVNVDKDELLKALRYDRGQYEKGYIDGRITRDAEIVRRKECAYAVKPKDGVLTEEYADWRLCCLQDGELFETTHYCGYGERREDATD